MTAEEIKSVVTLQRKYFNTGATLNINHRIQALQKLQGCIIKYETEISEALEKDLGKSNFEGYMCETGLVLSEISYMLKHIYSYAKEKTVRTPIA